MKETRQQFDARLYCVEDPVPAKEAAENLDKRKFWFVCVPLGAVIAFVLAVVAESGGVFCFAWPVVSLLLWGVSSGGDDGARR